MNRIIFLILGVSLSLGIFSCKSIDSSTSGRFNINNESIPIDRYIYIDVTRVYSDEGRTSKSVDHRYAVAEKQKDDTYILHFLHNRSYIPTSMNYLIDYFPKAIDFRALAVPASGNKFIIYASKTDKPRSQNVRGENIRSEQISAYDKEDFNIEVGTAALTSGKNCGNVNYNDKGKFDAPTDNCLVLIDMCTKAYANKCSLGWRQFYQRYGLPYHIVSINLP